MPIEKETLLEMLANATVTYYNCFGHSKAERNLCAMEEYKEQLKLMGCEVPTDEHLLTLGTFNGDGAR